MTWRKLQCCSWRHSVNRTFRTASEGTKSDEINLTTLRDGVFRMINGNVSFTFQIFHLFRHTFCLLITSFSIILSTHSSWVLEFWKVISRFSSKFKKQDIFVKPKIRYVNFNQLCSLFPCILSFTYVLTEVMLGKGLQTFVESKWQQIKVMTFYLVISVHIYNVENYL